MRPPLTADSAVVFGHHHNHRGAQSVVDKINAGGETAIACGPGITRGSPISTKTSSTVPTAPISDQRCSPRPFTGFDLLQ
jgi:hypothetical protein